MIMDYKLLGIYESLAGIKDSYILINSLVGCKLDRIQVKNKIENIDNDKKLNIYGGADLVRNKIRKIEREKSSKVIILISSYMTDADEEDMEKIVNEFSTPIIYINAGKINGGYSEGFEEGLLSLLDYMEEKEKEKYINIIGLEKDAYLLKEDIEVLKKIVAPEFKLNFIASDCEFKDIQNARKALLNISIDRGSSLCKEMKYRFGIDYIEINYPYGTVGLVSFLEKIGRYFDMDFSLKREHIERDLYEKIKLRYTCISRLYNRSVSIVASKKRALGLKTFLEKELAMKLIHIYYKEDIKENKSINMNLRDLDSLTLISDIFLDNLKLSPHYIKNENIKTSIGSEGSANLIDYIIENIDENYNLYGNNNKIMSN